MPKEKRTFADQKKRGDETSNGVVRGNQQVSVHEVWKKQQIQKDAKKMHRTKICVWEFWKMVKASIGRS